MGLLGKLSGIFAPKGDPYIYTIKVKCNRCGEIIQTRINIRNDLSIKYDDKGKMSYFTRKVLIGDKYCFERIEVELIFDASRKLVNRQISGGELVD